MSEKNLKLGPKPKRSEFEKGAHDIAMYEQALIVWILCNLATKHGTPVEDLRSTLRREDGRWTSWDFLFVESGK